MKKLSLSIGIFLLMSSNPTLASEDSWTLKNLPNQINSDAIGQLLSQVNGEIPEVIIDNEPPATEVPTSDTRRQSTNVNEDRRFSCKYVDGEYTVMYHPESQPKQVYPWATPGQMGGGWTEEKRCYAISQRLEQYRPDGLLELKTGVKNGYDILCVTTQAQSDCRILLTVPLGYDPEITRDLIFENLVTADAGRATQGINTFANNNQAGNLLGKIDRIWQSSNSTSRRKSDGIDLRPFLDFTDGGTGTQLTKGVSRTTVTPDSGNSRHRLNPDGFR